jgi:hypothetical protein
MRREQVAHVQDPEDLIERRAVGGVPRVRRVDDGCEALLRRQVDGDGHDLRPWDHHVVHLLVRELEGAVEHFVLDALDDAALAGFGDDQAHVLTGTGEHARGRRLDTEQPRHRRGRDLQQPDERP